MNGLSAALSLELFDPFSLIRGSVIWWLCLVRPDAPKADHAMQCFLLEYRKKEGCLARLASRLVPTSAR